jgi:hypothetical protein
VTKFLIPRQNAAVPVSRSKKCGSQEERLERHVQGFVRWAKGGLASLVDSQNVEHVFRAALNQAGIHSAALKHKSVLHKTKTIRGTLWYGYWQPRYW